MKYSAPLINFPKRTFSVIAMMLSAFTLNANAATQPAGYAEKVVNGVTVFGLDPAWTGGREFEKALDGDASTYYDFAYDDQETFVGFDNGEAARPVVLRFTPRARMAERMVGGRFEGSNESAHSGYETIYEVAATPEAGETEIALDTTSAYRYYRYWAPVNSYGNIAEFSIDLDAEAPVEPGPSAPEGMRYSNMNGTVIFGLDPAWSAGVEFEKALDGDTSTFYDFAYGEIETFVGFDNGEAARPVVLRFTPRARRAKRMVGARFEGSNESAYSGYETIYEVTSTPAGEETEIALDTTSAYRYYRYWAPVNSYGNIAEFSIDLDAEAPVEPVEPTPEPVEPTPEPVEPTPEPVEPTPEPVEPTPEPVEPGLSAPEGMRYSNMNGTVIFGLDPAWSAGGEFEKALDGDTSTFYDFAYGEIETFVGFDNGEAARPVVLRFTPRARRAKRMVGARFEGSNESAYSGYETIYEVTSTPAGEETEIALDTTSAYRYYRYWAPVNSYGNIAEFSIDLDAEAPVEPVEPTPEPVEPTPEPVEPTPEPVEPTPEPVEPTPEPVNPVVYPEGYREVNVNGSVVFGIDPAWTAGREFEVAFDESASTYYDYAYGNSESFVGIDNGESAELSSIHYIPRSRYSKRMLGGRFEGSNESSVSGYELIYEITVEPAQAEQVITVSAGQAYRYIRYVSPIGGYGNIAEFWVAYSDGSEPVTPVEPTPEPVEPTPEPVEPTPEPVESGPIGEIDVTVTPLDGTGVVFGFELAQDRNISAAVYDNGGRLLKSLLHGTALTAGAHQLKWDGLDRNGAPVPAGQYTLKLLQSDGIKAEYITNLGTNPGTNSYDTWVGNHNGAASVAVDSTGVYIAAPITETAPVLLKQSFDGSVRHWTRTRHDVTAGRFQGGNSLAADQQGRLYMLQQNGFLQVISTDEGTVEASWDVIPSGVNRSSATYDLYYEHELGHIAGSDVAAYGNIVVLSFRDQNSVRWINPANGSVSSDVSITEPLGVAVSASGAVYAISGNKVYRVSSNGTLTAVVSSGLNTPVRISIDRSNDTLLVVDGLLGSQVKRFSVSGQLLATYGRNGGREFGNYVAADYYAVTDVTSDGQGGFFVAEPESPPRRVAHMNSNGTLNQEWYGGMGYYAWAEPDPRDKTKAWIFTDDGLILAKINYATGKWSVLETWMTNLLADGLIVQQNAHTARWRVLYSGNQRFLISEGIPQVLSHTDGELRAVSVSSNNYDQIDVAKSLAGVTGNENSFRWLDANGDGLTQSSEFTFTGFRGSAEPKHISDDFSLIGFDRSSPEFIVRRTTPYWGPYGPYYPIGREAGLQVEVASKDTTFRCASRGAGVYQDEDGSYYGHYNLSEERHGAAWPTNEASVSRFVKWASDGEEQWSVGRHAYHGGLENPYIETSNGQLHVPARVIGEHEDVVILADRIEDPGIVWTKDGLYVGSLVDGRVSDGLPDLVYSWHLTDTGEEAIQTSDNASGGRLVSYSDGTVLWMTQGRNSVPTYTVHGLSDYERTEVTFNLSEQVSGAAMNGNGLTATYFQDREMTQVAGSRVETQVWHGQSASSEIRDGVLDGPKGAVYDWTNGVDMVSNDGEFSVRWKGEIEAPLTEEFMFSIYTRGGVRLWVNGKQVLFSWNEYTDRTESTPVEFTAGERYSIQLDYYSTDANPLVSLNWESLSLDRGRVPTKYLYSDSSAPIFAPHRYATDYIVTSSFVEDSGGMSDDLIDAYSVRGLRGWNIGQSGSHLGYSEIDFESGVSKVRFEGSGRAADGRYPFPVKVELRLDSPSGPKLATIEFAEEMQVLTADVDQSVSGKHKVYLINATQDTWHFIELRWFIFE